MIDRDINHLQPGFKSKLVKLLELTKAEGIDLFINETLRSYARSDELYAQGRTKPGPKVTNARGGYSNHNFGFAADLYPIVDGKPVMNFDRSAKLMQVMKRVAALAATCGIEWGGNWKSIIDLPHFQDTEAPSLPECRRRWPKGFIPNVTA